ncbi:sulfatase-like hydrolase/transferase [Planctomycetes bacterium CA13]
MRKFGFVCAWLTIGAMPVFGAEKPNLPDKPNLVVIMCDDLGYADVGFNGCRDIPTPNIDRIAESGVRCTSGYTAYSVCGPSRAGFITGRYGQRFGFERNPQYRTQDPNMGLPKEEKTFGEVLKQVGYKSGVVGKWHQGAHPSNHPLNRGFDFFYGHLGGGHQYFPEELKIKDSYVATNESESYRTWIMRNHEAVPPRKYLTEEFSDAAVEFVEVHKNDPFFLFLSYNAPHGPLQATEKYLSRFPKLEGKRQTYAAMVSCVDDGVGQLLSKLDELNLTEETLVFFLSDNGGPESKNGSDNGHLRGGKGDSWEGGFRVPFAVQWKGTLPSGAVYDLPVSSLDIMGTIVDLAGAPVDPRRPLDGVNLIPYLTGQNNDAPHEAIYLRKFDSQKYTVRRGDYKLHSEWRGDNPQLYNLEEDIGEQNNIASLHPEKIQQLEKLRRQWDSELIEPRFLGLIHTPEWQAKLKRQRAAKEKGASEWDWFKSLDKNKDGEVTKDEWLSWHKGSAARKGELYREEVTRKYFAQLDGNSDEIITRDELETREKK